VTMASAAFFEQNHIWQVYFDTIGSLTEVTLTYHRLLPDGATVKFDEDPHGVLDLSSGEDDHLVMDGFLSLIPDGELISCAIRSVKHVLGVWERAEYKHIFAEYDKQIVRTTFEGRLWNPDSSADFVFVGGDRDAHTTATIRRWIGVMQQELLQQKPEDPIPTLEKVLSFYNAVIYTQTTEIHILTSGERGQSSSRMKAALELVASRYGMALPPD